jgi:hypothetical protein
MPARRLLHTSGLSAAVAASIAGAAAAAPAAEAFSGAGTPCVSIQLAPTQTCRHTVLHGEYNWISGYASHGHLQCVGVMSETNVCTNTEGIFYVTDNVYASFYPKRGTFIHNHDANYYEYYTLWITGRS